MKRKKNIDNKICTVCNIDKDINNFYKKHSKCRRCNIKRAVKGYYDNKDKTSIQQYFLNEKNRDKLIQKQNDYRNKRNTDFKQLHGSYVEFQNKLKAMEDNFTKNDSEIN